MANYQPPLTDQQQRRIKMFVAALRSGLYKQTNSKLGKPVYSTGDGGYADEAMVIGEENCCLGVACRVAKLNGAEVERVVVGSWSVAYDNEEGMLPENVREWFGFESSNPDLFTPEFDSDEITQLVSATVTNDEWAWDFDKIASAFERTYLSYPPSDAPAVLIADNDPGDGEYFGPGHNGF